MLTQNLYTNVHESLIVMAHSLKQPQCSSTEKLINKFYNSYTMKYYSMIKKEWQIQQNGSQNYHTERSQKKDYTFYCFIYIKINLGNEN